MLTTILRPGKLAKRASTNLLLLLVGSAALIALTGCGPPGPRALREGDRLVQDGNYEDAIPILKDATQLLAHYPPAVQARAWNLLGLANQNTGHPGPAVQAYEQALKFDRNFAVVDYNLGCLELQQSNYPAAIFALTTYTTLHGSDANGYMRLGEALAHYGMLCSPRERGDVFRSSQSALNAAEKITPSAATANALGLLKLQERPSGPSPDSVKYAVRQFQLALERTPNYPPALLNLGIVDQQYLGDPKGALDRYHQYLALQPLPDNAASVEKVARKIEIEERIQIVPRNPQRPNPQVVNPAPIPLSNFVASQRRPPPGEIPPKPPPNTNERPASTPTTPAPVVAVAQPAKPSPPPPRSPPPPPKENSVAATETPVPTPAEPIPKPVTNIAPTPAATPSAPPSTPPASTPVIGQTAANEAKPITEPAAAPAPAPTTIPAAQTEPTVSLDAGTAEANQPRPKKTILDTLNPRNWFGSRKPTPDKASASDNPPAADRHERYVYPLPITPIPGDRAEAERFVQAGVQAQRQGRLPEAIADYQKAIDTDSTDAQAQISLGLASIDAKDYDGALTSLDRALNLQANSGDARYAFAWVLQKKGYYQDAADELEKLLAQHPDQVRAHLLLGNLYAQKLDQTRLAREHYMKALSLDPDNSQAPTIRNWLAKSR